MDEEKLEYVGFWRRVVASLIDTTLLVLVLGSVGFMIFGTIDPDTSATSLVINYFIPAVITVVFWVRLRGTPGKLMLSAHVVDADTGLALTPGRAVIRYVGYYISALPLLIGFIWIAFDRRKQGWHDKIANSVVVRPVANSQVSFVPQDKGSEPGRQ